MMIDVDEGELEDSLTSPMAVMAPCIGKMNFEFSARISTYQS